MSAPVRIRWAELFDDDDDNVRTITNENEGKLVNINNKITIDTSKISGSIVNQPYIPDEAPNIVMLNQVEVPKSIKNYQAPTQFAGMLRPKPTSFVADFGEWRPFTDTNEGFEDFDHVGVLDRDKSSVVIINGKSKNFYDIAADVSKYTTANSSDLEVSNDSRKTKLNAFSYINVLSEDISKQREQAYHYKRNFVGNVNDTRQIKAELPPVVLVVNPSTNIVGYDWIDKSNPLDYVQSVYDENAFLGANQTANIENKSDVISRDVTSSNIESAAVTPFNCFLLRLSQEGNGVINIISGTKSAFYMNSVGYFNLISIDDAKEFVSTQRWGMLVRGMTVKVNNDGSKEFGFSIDSNSNDMFTNSVSDSKDVDQYEISPVYAVLFRNVLEDTELYDIFMNAYSDFICGKSFPNEVTEYFKTVRITNDMRTIKPEDLKKVLLNYNARIFMVKQYYSGWKNIDDILGANSNSTFNAISSSLLWTESDNGVNFSQGFSGVGLNLTRNINYTTINT